MNAHVELFYRLLCLQAQHERRIMAQLHWFTMAMKECDPNWNPYSNDN